MMEVVGLKKLDEKMGFEETELRLGLPGNKGGSTTGTTTDQLGDINDVVVINRNKRGFSQTQEIQETDQTTTTTVDLMLNLSSNSKEPTDDTNKPNTLLPADPAKAQVVGWPPVRSYRKNMLAVQKSKEVESSEKNNINNISPNANGSFVKVSMDGAPYLRKVDLKLYNSYQHLSDSLANMFSSFTIGNCGSQGMKDFMNESRLMDLLNSSDYVPTYEDKDGDWMLVGDVPWEMFVDSCKRLRIMKGKEAIGLAPRAMEKFKNRS